MKHPHCVSTMLSDDERARVRSQADRDRRSVSTWIRLAVLAYLEKGEKK